MGGADVRRVRYETQSTQETEDEGTCKQSITRCWALFCKAGVWHSVKEAYKHMHPPGSSISSNMKKISQDAHEWEPISEKKSKFVQFWLNQCRIIKWCQGGRLEIWL